MEILNYPAFIINMDRCTDRLDESTKRIIAAGFKDIRRWRAVDAKNAHALEEGWRVHGSPKKDPDRPEFEEFKGEQGVALSQLSLWKYIVDNRIPRAVIFEDDVAFHKDWETLASVFWNATPKDFDVLYIGNQLEMYMPGEILQVPVYCLHAYIVTLEGAQKLYDCVLRRPQGMCAIDSVLIEYMWKHIHDLVEAARINAMTCPPPPFTWYAWNATGYPDEKATEHPEWRKRNTGLVFQDVKFGTYIRSRADIQTQL